METLFPNIDKPLARAGIVPREYQTLAHDQCFAEWDAGQAGALARMATGLGKTLTACLVGDTWLRRSENHRLMVVSYERQLVWQFAEEIHDYLGVEPGVEMEKEEAKGSDRIVVASRQTILPSSPPTQKQAEELASFGIKAMDVHSKRLAGVYLKHLRSGGDRDVVVDDLIEKNLNPLLVNGVYSRLHKFDWRLMWLVIFDEAHRHAYKLPSVGHIVDWFSQNPGHRRMGLTATPKRADGVSIGDVMFPAIAIDYPLFSRSRACAVKDGWAVPYVQRYIEVEGVDFKNLKRISETEGADFDEDALATALGEEETLAKLVGPMLDMVGDRRTLIFNPGVEMAKNVARFINARSPATCACGVTKWYPSTLIGDGAECECGEPITPRMVKREGEQAKSLDGSVAARDRKEVYRAHQKGEFQFLSVCGLCREGYNDPDIACVTVFRPVSKKASSLAEQMKGRACRPLRSVAKILHTLSDSEARCKAIADSDKPNALIIDLVGITGLADCASTVAIYAEGLPDEIIARAEDILAEQAEDEEVDVDEAIKQAQREAEETKERIRKEREEAERKAKEEFERRSKAQAEARYTTHDVGYGSAVNGNDASDAQMKFIRTLGMDISGRTVSKSQAGRIISMLKRRVPVEQVAHENGIATDHYKSAGPSVKQLQRIRREGLSTDGIKTTWDGMQVLSAKLERDRWVSDKLNAIASARTNEELNAVAQDLCKARQALDPESFKRITQAGSLKRCSFQGDSAE